MYEHHVAQATSYLKSVRRFLKKFRRFAGPYLRGLKGLNLDALIAEIDEEAKNEKALTLQLETLVARAETIARRSA